METSPDNDFSFDIIECLPEDICDNIFGNLESRDLLEASLVSTEWNKFIGKSAVCMQKLKLKFSFENLKEQTLVTVRLMLMNSNRKYENVEFLKLKLNDVRSILLIPERKWKNVKMTYLNVPTEVDFINLIANIEPFVEELKMASFELRCDNPKKLKPSEQQTKSLTFPNLKFLEVDGYYESRVEVFQDVVTLTEFNLTTFDTSSRSINAIQKMFRCNKGLKKLLTSLRPFDLMICGEISRDITFKLISLQILDHGWTSYMTNTNFKQFLELHMNTLESLSLAEWMGLETAKMIFHMPKLKHLSFDLKRCHRVEETVDWKEISFKQNLSLTSFDFGETNFKVEILRAFLIATPNVKKLKLRSIIDENIACVSNLLPNLESLSVEWFDVFDVTDKTYFPNLKELSMKYCDEQIKESEAEEDRSKLESLFLAEKKKLTDRRINDE